MTLSFERYCLIGQLQVEMHCWCGGSTMPDGVCCIPVCEAAFAAYRLSNEVHREGDGDVTLFSPQEMLNHIDAFYPPLADTLKNFPGGFGYPKSLRKAFKYLTEFGVCREDACPYDSKIHRQDSPPLAIPRVFILEYGNLKNVHEVSLHIKEHPLVLAVPFVKYLTSYKKGIYDGPTKVEKNEINDKIDKKKPINKHAFQLIGW
ncbi:hypothetical protein PHJA_001499400 [Phtheirospermum japonicum]|uniref:Uncharacterized protein n=1 Tax=Phtheirospermum japonicum TaxID=374723 RepID=A0A830C1N4_9LAMI|nr:hypothetical protein PHJA_001499400 [Phtheirospermum japonicum]